MGLGPTHTVDLKQARAKAREARVLLLEGIDPLEQPMQANGSDMMRVAACLGSERGIEAGGLRQLGV
jgi:hypothetical protein